MVTTTADPAFDRNTRSISVRFTPTRLIARAATCVMALALAGCAGVPSLALKLPTWGAPAETAEPVEPAPAPAMVEKPRPKSPPPGERAVPEDHGPQGDLLGVLGYALSLEGAPYRYGGDNPRTGFDCSGFVRHIYGQLGLELPRSSAEIAKALPEIDLGERKVGDLVLFKINKNRFSHVGIYLGENQFIHATSSRTKRVMVSDLNDTYWRNRFQGVRRPDWDTVAANPAPPTGVQLAQLLTR